MSLSAFAAVLGPFTGSIASARGEKAGARPVGDDADFAAALNDAAAADAPARPTVVSKKGETSGAAPEGEGVDTIDAAAEAVSDVPATAPDAPPAVPVDGPPIATPKAPAAPTLNDGDAEPDAGGGSGKAVPALDLAGDRSAGPTDETPALPSEADDGATKGRASPVVQSLETSTEPGTRLDKAGDAAEPARFDPPPASDRTREVAALSSAVLTPVRPAKPVVSAEPALEPVEDAEAAPAEDTGDAAAVATAPATRPDPVRVRDVIDRAATRAGESQGQTESDPAAPGSAKSSDNAASQTSAQKPGPATLELGAQPLASVDPVEEPTRAPPVPGAPASPEARAAEAAQPPGLSTLSQSAVEATVQIAAQIVKRLEGRSTRFELALTPEGLGRVDISLDIEADGALRATLAFDNPVAATDLRARADELRRQLLDAGFTLADDALSFAERDPTAGQGSGFERSSDRHNARAFGAASRLSLEADVSAQPSRWINLSLTPAGVDMKV